MEAEQIEALIKLKFNISLSQLPAFKKMLALVEKNIRDETSEENEGKKYFIQPPENFMMTMEEYKKLSLEEQIKFNTILNLSGLINGKIISIYTEEILYRFEVFKIIDFSDLPFEKTIIEVDEKNKIVIFTPNYSKINVIDSEQIYEIFDEQLQNLLSIYRTLSKKEKYIKLEYTKENMDLLKAMNITFKINYNTGLIEADLE